MLLEQVAMFSGHFVCKNWLIEFAAGTSCRSEQFCKGSLSVLTCWVALCQQSLICCQIDIWVERNCAANLASGEEMTNTRLANLPVLQRQFEGGA